MTARSKALIEQAKRFARQAETLPEGDDKRQWLESEAGRLYDEARELTDEAKKAASKYSD
ncbi:MAG: hypothetical protein HKM95_05425 [Inquilinus sp.]|nr:hypothetical protein [Inquilinus sp.]